MTYFSDCLCAKPAIDGSVQQEEKRATAQRVEEAQAKRIEAESTLQIRMIEYDRVAKLLANTQAELRKMREAAVREGDESAAQVLQL